MQILTLERVLDFINLYYADDRLDIEIPALYDTKLTYEAFWRRENDEPRWLIGIKGSSNFEPIETSNITDFFNNKKLDLVEFQITLMDKILINVGHIAIIVKQARILLTDELVDQAIDKVEEIYSEIDNTIEKIIEPKQDEKTLKQDKKTKLNKTKKGNLKLVKHSPQNE